MPPAAEKVETGVSKSDLLEALKLVIANQPRSELTDGVLDRLAGKINGENRSNPQYPGISTLTYPEGQRARPKPTLTREVWHNSARIREDQCTPEEILAWNALSASLPQPGDERSTRDGRWTAKVSRNGQKLIVLIPCKTIEERDEANMSTVLMFCRELAEGGQAITPQSMAADIEQLKSDRDRLEKLLAANGITLPVVAPAAP